MVIVMKKFIYLFLASLMFSISHAETYSLVSNYSENANRAIRWNDGVVKIYDCTQFSELQKVLDLLNKYTQKTKFVTTDYPEEAQITITWADYFDFPYQDKCGLTQTYIENNQYSKATIQLRHGACTRKGTLISLYIHELGHALGFARHTDNTDVMAEALADSGHYESVGILTQFLNGLYYLNPGDNIDKNAILPRAEGKNLFEKYDITKSNNSTNRKEKIEALVLKEKHKKTDTNVSLISIIPGDTKNTQNTNVLGASEPPKNTKYKQIN